MNVTNYIRYTVKQCIPLITLSIRNDYASDRMIYMINLNAQLNCYVYFLVYFVTIHAFAYIPWFCATNAFVDTNGQFVTPVTLDI